MPHLCDDNSFRPAPAPFTTEEMQTMERLLGPEFDIMKGPIEIDLLQVFPLTAGIIYQFIDMIQAAQGLDYANILLSDTDTYLHRISIPSFTTTK